MDFFLRFALISFAAIAFFTIGLGAALSGRITFNLVKLGFIFSIIALFLSISYKTESLQTRLLISLLWTFILGYGFRFGRKIIQRERD